MRRYWHALALAATLLLVPGASRAQERFEQGLLELRVAGTNPLLAQTLVDSAGRTLVPLSEVLRLTQIPFTQTPTGWSLQWPPPDFATTLDPVTGRFTREGTADSIPANERHYQAPELFLSIPAVQRVLAIQIQYLPEELTAILSTAGGFPVNRRADLERRLRARTPGPDRALLEGVPYRSVTGGFAFNWSASANLADGQATTASLRGAAGAALLGGEIELSADVFASGSNGSNALLRYSRPFPENRWIQQLTAGALTTRTPEPVFMHGVVISNTPYIPPEFFQATVLRPTVPTGWVAEVYEGNHLLGVAQDVSLEGVEVPLSYGMNPVRVKLIGPAGQELVEDVQYLVPHARVPVGALRYSLGAGRCRLACDEYAYGELSTGIRLGLSAGAGVEYATRDSADQARPYLSLGVNPRPDLTIDARSVLGYHTQVDAQYAGLENANLQFALSHSSRQALGGAYSPGLRLSLNGAVRAWRRTFTLLNQLTDSRGTGVDRFMTSLGTPLGDGFVFLQHEFSRRSPDIFSARVTRSWANPFLRTAPISTEAHLGTSGDGLDMATLQVSVQLPRYGSVRIRSHWRSGVAPVVALSLHSRRSHFTASSNVSVQKQRTSASLSAAGSLVVDPARDLHAAPEAAVGLAGIAGRAFLDENGNGRFDRNEAVVPDVAITADGRIATTDETGRFALWGVRPVRPTAFVVDTLAVPSIELMAIDPVRFLRPVPNTFINADIPFVRTREVSGRLLGIRNTGIGGVSVELRSPDGALAAETRSFGDGTFYFPRVAPGSYLLRLAPASLAALGIATALDPIPVTVPTGQGPPITIDPIRFDR